MGLSKITSDDVLKAIEEFQKLGRSSFLEEYGFGEARTHFLVHEGKEYDSKAIAGVAHKYSQGRPMNSSEFSGGDATVRRKLQSLGFIVRSSRNPTWTWDELVLACDLVVRNGWVALGANDERIRELSSLLQCLPVHPQGERSATFRNVNGVARKTADIATAHPDCQGVSTNGGRLDKDVLQEFLDRPEEMRSAAESIRQGVLSGEFDRFPAGESSDDEQEGAPEGRLLLRRHYARERNPALRVKKIDQVLKSGLPIACEACDFDFEHTYGSHGSGYIEVHHIVPLHHIGESKTRLSDLALLCANCHRMIHRSRPWLTPDDVRQLVHQRASAVRNG